MGIYTVHRQSGYMNRKLTSDCEQDDLPSSSIIFISAVSLPAVKVPTAVPPTTVAWSGMFSMFSTVLSFTTGTLNNRVVNGPEPAVKVRVAELLVKSNPIVGEPVCSYTTCISNEQLPVLQ